MRIRLDFILCNEAAYISVYVALIVGCVVNEWGMEKDLEEGGNILNEKIPGIYLEAFRKN